MATVDELCEAIRTLAVEGSTGPGGGWSDGGRTAATWPGEDLVERLPGSWLPDQRRSTCAGEWKGPSLLSIQSPRQSLWHRRMQNAIAVSAARRRVVPGDARVLTHCNAGSLACVEYGTALGVSRAAHEAGKVTSVWVDETIPVLQGSRL